MDPANNDVERGAAAYSPTALRFYDRIVLGLYFSYAWRCPTKTQLIPFFKANSTPTSSDSTHSRRLLDIGVGTGFFLEHAQLASGSSLTLGPFDAISVMLLLHCVPGPPSRKAAACGVLFGVTILGKGVTHNLFGRLLMWWHNRTGIFD
ncbi:hypothetical protein FB451DRAFT_1339044 [Mycena latifolia]|nr:hypothetical protein FB451DRAFT_1339044 [Mycena latifolia]